MSINADINTAVRLAIQPFINSKRFDDIWIELGLIQYECKVLSAIEDKKQIND
jgi:hypothetical protein